VKDLCLTAKENKPDLAENPQKGTAMKNVQTPIRRQADGPPSARNRARLNINRTANRKDEK